MPVDMATRRNFEKGLQYKCALMHARVRENKVGFVTFHVIIHENIQIERPGRIRIFARAPMAAPARSAITSRRTER